MRRRRWRTAVLWVGSLLCVLVALLFVASAWWWVELPVPTPSDRDLMVSIDDGAIRLELIRTEGRFLPMLKPASLRDWNLWVQRRRVIVVPLYAVFAAVAIPTLLAWRFGPKPARPGHCQRCGYNLTGLTEARCPECGAEFEADVG